MDTEPPTPHHTAEPMPTNTPPPAPTRTPRPTTPGTPQPTGEPGIPTPTSLPGYEDTSDVSWPVPPEAIPAPWVGVADFLRQNVCVTRGGITTCQGDWVVNSNSSLYENSLLRCSVARPNPVSQGDKRPDDPADDVHIPRPRCLVGDEWIYVPGTWYYNGLSDVVNDPDWFDTQVVHYGPPEYPVEWNVLVRYHRAYVPEPAYPGRTAWNFGALGECRDLGGGGGGGEPPPPLPSPTPGPTPAGCPACSVDVFPAGTLDSPYLTPWETISLTWTCQAGRGEPSGYVARTFVPVGEEWVVRDRRDLPADTRQQTFAVVPGFLYRAEITALFDVDGDETACCAGATYYRYALEVPTATGSLEARVEYWSEHDPDYPAHGPDNPYRTAGPLLRWNYGEMLHAHPTADLVEPPPPSADWTVRTDLLRWRYRGSTTGVWHPARCDPPAAASCGWFDELPRQYVHLRWFKNLLPGETEGVAVDDERTWVYATDPTTVTLSYQVQAETTWTNTQTHFEITWPAFTTTLTVTVALQYPTTYRGGR